MHAAGALATYAPSRRHPVGTTKMRRADWPYLTLPTVLASALLLHAACGGHAADDARGREIGWTYGPTTGGASALHVQGTGTKRGEPVAQGWQLRLRDTRLMVVPYRLAASHALFGKVALSIGLFDVEGKPIGTVRSPAVTAGQADFAFELEAAVAARLWDVVIWYVEP
ncbi:MAG: hypothetical protein KF830_17440 [Planctomycetes bacterium]|nr:hypothetical protein [Planctomycetota bacterium]